ncbi:MAG TPA: hypothetical protein VG712_03640 [Gemmatimonadales bacterium]|nr:hypothetical protein [Gemmatimonadales bacterium]
MRRSRTMLFLGAAAVGVAAGWMLAGRHIRRHRTALFSPRPLQRLSALAGLAAEPSVANVRLLQDYLAWETRPLLRRRASALLRRMEATLIDPRPVGV